MKARLPRAGGLFCVFRATAKALVFLRKKPADEKRRERDAGLPSLWKDGRSEKCRGPCRTRREQKRAFRAGNGDVGEREPEGGLPAGDGRLRAAGLMIRAGNPEKLRCVVFRNFRKRAETYRRGKGGIMFRPVFRRSCRVAGRSVLLAGATGQRRLLRRDGRCAGGCPQAGLPGKAAKKFPLRELTV